LEVLLTQEFSIAGHALAVAKRNWSGSQEKLRQAYKTNIEWFLKRKEIPAKELATVNFQRDKYLQSLNDDFP